MLYGYARCSTDESKQDIDRQKRELKKLGIKESNIISEYESGTKTDRDKLTNLLYALNPGDTIAATEVSRLTRSTKHLCEIIDFAKKRRLQIIIGTFTVDCRGPVLDPMTQGMIMMWAVFSEMERNILSQRVKSGMENAKAKGAVIGRPTVTIDNLPPLFLKHYHKYRDKLINQEELARLCEVSRQSVVKYIKIYKQGAAAE